MHRNGAFPGARLFLVRTDRLRPGFAPVAGLRRRRGGTSRALPTSIMAKAPYAIAWLLGIPIPILLLVYLFSHAC